MKHLVRAAYFSKRKRKKRKISRWKMDKVSEMILLSLSLFIYFSKIVFKVARKKCQKTLI